MKPVVGRLQDCLENNESPNLISLGTMVEEEGFDFEWKHGHKPKFTTPKGENVPVKVEDKIPKLCGAVTEKGSDQQSDPNVLLEAVAEDFLHYVFDTVVEEAISEACESNEEMKNLVASMKKKKASQHDLTHLPADPENCPVCHAKFQERLPNVYLLRSVRQPQQLFLVRKFIVICWDPLLPHTNMKDTSCLQEMRQQIGQLSIQ